MDDQRSMEFKNGEYATWDFGAGEIIKNMGKMVKVCVAASTRNAGLAKVKMQNSMVCTIAQR